MNQALFENELHRLQENLEQSEAFSYQSTRGVDDADEEITLFNRIVWEVTDFLCSRTGKYDPIKDELDDLVGDGVKIVAGAVAATMGVVSGGLLIAIERVLKVIIKIGTQQACANLPLEKPDAQR